MKPQLIAYYLALHRFGKRDPNFADAVGHSFGKSLLCSPQPDLQFGYSLEEKSKRNYTENRILAVR